MRRRVCFLCIVLILFSIPVFAADLFLPDSTDTTTEGGSWKTVSIVDKYGDVIGRAISARFYGSFSNVATQSSDFIGDLVITKTEAYFTIYEYGKYLATGYGTSDKYYLSFGNERIELYLDGNGRFVANNKDSQKIVEAIARLSSNGVIGVRISGGKYSTSTYTASLETKGFGRVAKNILTKQSVAEAARQERIENNKAAAFTFSTSVIADKMGLFYYHCRYKSIGFSVGIVGYDPIVPNRKINIAENDGLQLGITYPVGEKLVLFAGGELGAGWGVAAGGIFFVSPICFTAEVSYNFHRSNFHFCIGVGLGGWNAVD